MSYLRREFIYVMLDLGLTHLKPCSSEENNKYEEMERKGSILPVGVFRSNSFVPAQYKIAAKPDLSSEEINKLMMYKQTLYLNSIRKSMIFFVIFAIISLIASLILAFAV